MDEAELPRSAVSLVRELFEEVLEQLEGANLFIDDDYHLSTSGDTKGAIKAEIAEYRRRFKEIEKNLYSGPNRGR